MLSSQGVLSGIPTKAGTYTLLINLSDGVGSNNPYGMAYTVASEVIHDDRPGAGMIISQAITLLPHQGTASTQSYLYLFGDWRDGCALLNDP